MYHTLEEILKTIDGLKLQAKVAADGLKNKPFTIDKKEMAKAHSIINASIVTSGILDRFLDEFQLESYIQIDNRAFERWFTREQRSLIAKLTNGETK